MMMMMMTRLYIYTVFILVLSPLAFSLVGFPCVFEAFLFFSFLTFGSGSAARCPARLAVPGSQLRARDRLRATVGSHGQKIK